MMAPIWCLVKQSNPLLRSATTAATSLIMTHTLYDSNMNWTQNTSSHRALLEESIKESSQTISQIDQKQKALAEEVKKVCNWQQHYRVAPTKEDLRKIKALRDKKIWPLLDSCGEAAGVIGGIQATLDMLTGRTKPPEPEPSLSCSEAETETKQLPGRRCKYKNHQESLDVLWARMKHIETEVRISESLCNAKLNQVV